MGFVDNLSSMGAVYIVEDVDVGVGTLDMRIIDNHSVNIVSIVTRIGTK